MGIFRKLKYICRARLGAPRIMDFHFLCFQLYELLGAGFPMLTALQTTFENTQNLHLRSSLRQLIWKIKKGEKWEHSLRSLRPGFPPFLTNMLILGNRTGNLTTVLFLLAQYYRVLHFLKRNIFLLIWYPMVLLSAYCLIMSVRNVALEFVHYSPSTLEIFLTFWEGFRPLFLSALFAYALVNIIKRSELRKYVDHTVIRLPIFGKFLKEFYLANFFRALAISMECGMLVEEAFLLATDTVENEWLKRRLLLSRKFLRDGESLHSALAISQALPQEALSMTVVADTTAEWTSLCNKLADYYQVRIEATTPGVAKAFGPLFLILMAIVFFGDVLFEFMAVTLFFLYFLIR